MRKYSFDNGNCKLSLSFGKLHSKTYSYSFVYVNDGKNSYVEIDGEKKNLSKISSKDKKKIKNIRTMENDRCVF